MSGEGKTSQVALAVARKLASGTPALNFIGAELALTLEEGMRTNTFITLHPRLKLHI